MNLIHTVSIACLIFGIIFVVSFKSCMTEVSRSWKEEKIKQCHDIANLHGLKSAYVAEECYFEVDGKWVKKDVYESEI